MLKARVHQNTVLLTFEQEQAPVINLVGSLKNELFRYLRMPHTNLLIDFKNMVAFTEEALDALEAGQRLSELTHCQLTLFNVGKEALKLMRRKKADHHFFFGDRPKPFSEEILLV